MVEINKEFINNLNTKFYSSRIDEFEETCDNVSSNIISIEDKNKQEILTDQYNSELEAIKNQIIESNGSIIEEAIKILEENIKEKVVISQDQQDFFKEIVDKMASNSDYNDYIKQDKSNFTIIFKHKGFRNFVLKNDSTSDIPQHCQNLCAKKDEANLLIGVLNDYLRRKNKKILEPEYLYVDDNDNSKELQNNSEQVNVSQFNKQNINQNSEQKIIDIFDSKIGQNKDNLDFSNTGYLEINANTNINGLKDDKAIPIEMFGKEKAYNGFMTNWNKSTLFFKGEGQYKEAKIYKNISVIKRLFNDRFWKGLKEQKINTKDINTLLLNDKHIVVNGKIFGSKDYYTLPIPGLKPSTTFNFNNGKFFGCKNLIALQLSNSMWKKLVNDCYIDLNESLKRTADLLFKKFKHLEQLQIVSDTETTTITRDSWKTYNYSNNNLDKAYNIQQYQEALDKGLKAGYDVNNTSDITQLEHNNKKQKEELGNKYDNMLDVTQLQGSIPHKAWRLITTPIRFILKLSFLGLLGGILPSNSYRRSYGFGGFGGGMMGGFGSGMIGAYGGRRGFGSTRRMGFGNRRLNNTRRTNRKTW